MGNAEYLEVEFQGQRQAVPVWMTDEQLCAGMTLGIVPLCSLSHLSQLQSLLRSARL